MKTSACLHEPLPERRRSRGGRPHARELARLPDLSAHDRLGNRGVLRALDALRDPARGFSAEARPIARRYGVADPPEGVRVGSVVGAPAQQAGMKVDDVIIAWNGERIGDFMDLSMRIARTAPDTKVTVTVRRDGNALPLEVTVGQREPGQ